MERSHLFRRVVIETTGLADPAPILHTLISDPLIAARYMLDGVVATVDAVNGAGTLDRQPEAIKQAAVADRLLLTKTDLAEAGSAAALKARLAALNPGASVLSVAQGEVDPALLFNLGFYDPKTKSVDVQRWLRDEAFEAGHEHEHEDAAQDAHEHGQLDVNRHDDRIRAFCITRERPISWSALSTWLDALATMRGDDLLRLKAIVALSDRPGEPVLWCTACSISFTRRSCCRNGRATTTAPGWCSSPATCRARRSKRPWRLSKKRSSSRDNRAAVSRSGSGLRSGSFRGCRGRGRGGGARRQTGRAPR